MESVRSTQRDAREPGVCLVLMPYAVMSRPSLALGLLKAALTRADIPSSAVYANLRFMETIGFQAYRMMLLLSPLDLVGDWTFAGAAFPGQRSDHSIHLQRAADMLLRRHGGPSRAAGAEGVVREFHRIRDAAPAFVDALAREILARHPQVVGCSSTFVQQAPSLALLRRIRELDPRVVTLIGGANCDDRMGVATVREFPWVDVVFSGEADEAMVPLCRLLLEHGRDVPTNALPPGAMTCALAEKFTADSPIPRGQVQNLDQLPIPDFSDYFETLRHASFRSVSPSGLPAETSRGCWWGARKGCTFCGLNGAGKHFRSKSAKRVLHEFRTLSETYGLRCFDMADNIMDMAYFRSVLPQLAALPEPCEFFFEVKAGLTRDQVRRLAAAGVFWIQPGIEALHDGLLRLMRKGCSTLKNLALLKYCREFGVNPIWNALFGFPGECDAWYRDTAAWLPLIHHFTPPSLVTHIVFERFSEYHADPARFGLRLEPLPSYASVYPVSEAGRHDLAYFFRDLGAEAAERGAPAEPAPGLAAFQTAILAWIAAQRAVIPPLLCLTDTGDALDIYDTRACAPERRVRLAGLQAEVYRACEPAIARSALLRRFPGQASAEVEQAVAELSARRLLLECGCRLLSLAVPGDHPELRPIAMFQVCAAGHGEFSAYLEQMFRGWDPV